MEHKDRFPLKAALAWAGVFAFRLVLLPVRAPNVEPLMATLMPVSRRLGAFSSFVFAAASIVVYDLFTAGLGSWTLAAALAYGLVAVAAHAYFSRREDTRARFVGFSIIATLAYDAATGLTVGPLVFGQTFAAALAGQIPFTLLHLAGNIAFAATLSPVLSHWFATAPVAATAPARQTV